MLSTGDLARTLRDDLSCGGEMRTGADDDDSLVGDEREDVLLKLKGARTAAADREGGQPCPVSKAERSTHLAEAARREKRACWGSRAAAQATRTAKAG